MASEPVSKDVDIELEPDAWARFEAAVDQVVKPTKTGPPPREAKQPDRSHKP